jgi:hypothetical protein
MTQHDPWDDARLDAAYTAYASAASPPRLDAGDIRARLERPPTRGIRSWRGALGATVVVATIVAGSVGGLALLGQTADPAAPDPTPATEAFGLPVISVLEALALRDAGVGDRELAVRGWFSPIGPISCPAPATWPVSPVEPNCPDDWIVLMSEPESLVAVTQDGAISEGRGPTAPAIRIDLDDLDTSWMPTLPELGPAVPVELVVLGHFDDRRSALCPELVQQQCRDRMVVDRVVSVDGVQQRPAPVIGVDRVEVGQDAVGTFIEHQAPGGVILAMTVVDGETGICRIEPSLGTGQGGFIDQRAIWVVQSLEGDQVTTYLVVDGSAVVHRMERDGSVTRISPEPAAETPSPDGVLVVELTSPVAAGSPPARVTVVDTIGIVGFVREVGPEDRPMRPNEDAFARDPDVDGRYRLWWMGSICDGAIIVTIADAEPGLTRITIDHGTRPACDALGVARELVLDLTRSLDTTGVELVTVPPPLP